MLHTCPVCLGVVLVLLYHLKSAAGPAAGLQHARRRVSQSVMSLEGLADTVTVLRESKENVQCYTLYVWQKSFD